MTLILGQKYATDIKAAQTPCTSHLVMLQEKEEEYPL